MTAGYKISGFNKDMRDDLASTGKYSEKANFQNYYYNFC